MSYHPHEPTMYDVNPYNQNYIRPATNEGYYKEPGMSTEKYVRYNQPPRSCCDQICCGCCTCCPRWYRWITCILFLFILAIAIIIGVLISQFKMPQVNFTGIQGTPSFGMSQSIVNLGVNLGFSVNNPNIESITFSSLNAKAFYHGYDDTSIGGGTLHDLHISSNAVTNIQFPFTLKVNMTSQRDQVIVSKLLSDCGIGSGEQQKIKLDYKVLATIDIIGLSIHIPFSNAVDFDCPMNSAIQQNILGSLGKTVSSLLGQNITNTLSETLPSLSTSNLSNLASNLPPLASNLPSLPSKVASLLK